MDGFKENVILVEYQILCKDIDMSKKVPCIIEEYRVKGEEYKLWGFLYSHPDEGLYLFRKANIRGPAKDIPKKRELKEFTAVPVKDIDEVYKGLLDKIKEEFPLIMRKRKVEGMSPEYMGTIEQWITA
jgi:hypothetical protein